MVEWYNGRMTQWEKNDTMGEEGGQIVATRGQIMYLGEGQIMLNGRRMVEW